MGRAEREARASLALRTQQNGPAFVTLTSALMAQHRFADAFGVARQLVAGDSAVPQYDSLLAETQLELGDYEGAKASFAAVTTERTSLSVAPRLARWAELRGETALARAILARARREAASRTDLPREQVAWFDLRVGDSLDVRIGARSARLPWRHTFSDVAVGQPLAVMHERGLLSFSINQGDLASAWGVKRGDTVLVRRAAEAPPR